MQIFKHDGDKPYASGTPDYFSRALQEKEFVSAAYRSPFEILGESIVPGLTTVPAILQGTFVQLTNLDNARQVQFLLIYLPTKAFNFGPSAENVTLNANFIDGNLDVFNFTEDLKKGPPYYLSLQIPPLKTFIVGIQYAIIPKMDEQLSAPQPVGPEALGNRGAINILAPGPALVTPTIRQVFIKSLAEPSTIISATAYSVPISKEEFSAPPREYLSLLHTK